MTGLGMDRDGGAVGVRCVGVVWWCPDLEYACTVPHSRTDGSSD